MRTYGDLCGIARALDVVGERWALLVVRELLLGPKRFTDLRRGLPNVGPDVLSQRLRELEQELEPVLLALGAWGSAAPVPPGNPQLGVDSAMIALRTLFDAGAARGLDATFELRLGDQLFRARVAGGELDLERGEAPDADATISADPMTLGGVLWERVGLAEAERTGAMTIEGDRRAARRFLELFPLPESTPAV